MKIRKLFSRAKFRSAAARLPRAPFRLFPLAPDLRSYDGARFAADARAGFNVALLAFPQGLVFSLIAGLPLYHGIYACVAGLALGAVFSGSRHASFGPSLTTAILLASILAQLNVAPGERADVLTILMVVAAGFLIVGAWSRLALLTRFISRSVTTGFILAAGLLIGASQIKHLCGIPVEDTGVFVRDIGLTFGAITETHWPSLVVGLVSTAVFIWVARRFRLAPSAAAAVAAGSLAGWILSLAGHPVETLQGIERIHLPETLRTVRFEWLGLITSAAFAVALLSHLEVSLIARSFAARSGERFSSNQHLFGIGMANLGNALFSGMPTSASLSRSRLNWRSRPATAIAGVLAGLFCAFLFIAFSGAIDHVPRAAIAAVAILLATEMVSRHYIRVIMKTSAADTWVLATTVITGLLFRLDIALYIGAGVSIVFFLRRVGVPELSEFQFTDEGRLAALDAKKVRTIPDISIVHVEGDLFFGAAEIFLEQARHMIDDPNLKVIILRMRNAHHLDATCALAIEEFLKFAAEHDRHVIVSGAHRGIYRVFKNCGLFERIGRENFFMDVPSNPTLSTRNALKRANALLGGADANIRIYVDPAKTRDEGGAETE